MMAHSGDRIALCGTNPQAVSTSALTASSAGDSLIAPINPRKISRTDVGMKGHPSRGVIADWTA